MKKPKFPRGGIAIASLSPRLRWRAIIAGPMCLATPAGAQQWEVVGQPGGYQVARVDGGGSVAGLGLTCEKGVPVVALRLMRPASRSPAAATVRVGDFTARLAIIRNGATDVWVGSIRDTKLLEAIARSPGGTRIEVAVDGGQSGALPSNGAGEALQRALGSCYRPARAFVTAPSGTSIPAGIDENALPLVLRQDLADFRASCAGWKFDWGDARGQPVLEAGWINRADFNGDGVADYLVDARKWRCSKEQAGGYPGPHLMLYTSQADGSYIASLDVPAITSFRIVPGSRAEIRIHIDATEEDVDAPATPAINETLTMIDTTSWTKSPSASTSPNWRLVAAERYPTAIGSLFSEWDRQCAATGRRLVSPHSTINDRRTIDAAGKSRELPIDLNADGKPDYLLDTTPMLCGPFGSNPQPRWSSAPANGVLIAIVSKPGDEFALSPILKSISLEGNGDPASIEHVGARDTVCFFEDMASGGPARLVRYSWTGTVATRTVLPDRRGCDGKRY